MPVNGGGEETPLRASVRLNVQWPAHCDLTGLPAVTAVTPADSQQDGQHSSEVGNFVSVRGLDTF